MGASSGTVDFGLQLWTSELFFTSGVALKSPRFPKHTVSQPNWFSPPWGEDVQMVEVTAELGERFKLE